MDPRLHLADILEQEATDDFRAASWFIDGVTERCRVKREHARTLRDHVAQEAEIQELERQANADLVRRGIRRRRVV